MFCESCNDSFYGQAISTGSCKVCGEGIYCPHLPCYEICKVCSDKLNICEQCGKEK